ncbi:UNVERIFIED_CONTAM: hypothetical protein Sangu_2423700 [Sesamum angustifolium]|uniref:Retrotransposon gag domain-containing protein n=1 Tax=Sesamum angustifolium TaxID=2727405 RepID=A0AAW2KZE6_9LAMI
MDEFLANCRTLAITEYDGTTDPQEHLSCFENAALLHRYTNRIKYRVFFTTFARAAQQWFNQLPSEPIGSFQEFRSLFLHQFAKVSSATQEVKVSAVSQGLLDGDFFKSLAKKLVSKIDTLLARAANRAQTNDPPHREAIRMIVGGPTGWDSHQARKAQVREGHDVSLKEVLDVEAMEDTSLIQFRRTEKLGLKTHHNDALVITALLANYEVGRIFIDSGSIVDILFEEAYDQMQLGDIPLEKVNTSLYGFAGEVVHPRGLTSLPLMLGTRTP